MAQRQAVGPPATVDGVSNLPPPITRDGITYYPASEVAQRMGVHMEWDPSTRTVYADGRPIPIKTLVVGQYLYLAWNPSSVPNTNGMPNAERRGSQPELHAIRAEDYYRNWMNSIIPQSPDMPRLSPPTETKVPYNPWDAPSRQQPVVDNSSRAVGQPARLQPGAAPTPTSINTNQLPSTIPPPGWAPAPTRNLGAQQGTQPVNGRPPLMVRTMGGADHLEASTRPNLTPSPYQAPRDYTAPPPPPSAPAHFRPQVGRNGIFEVRVKGFKQTTRFEGVVPAPSGKKFVVVMVTEKNVSNVRQDDTGVFALFDSAGNRHADHRELSALEMKALRPGDVNAGHLVFEIPTDAQPAFIELEGTWPLKIKLH